MLNQETGGTRAAFTKLDRKTRRFVPITLDAIPCPGLPGETCKGWRCLKCPGHGFIPAETYKPWNPWK